MKCYRLLLMLLFKSQVLQCTTDDAREHVEAKEVVDADVEWGKDFLSHHSISKRAAEDVEIERDALYNVSVDNEMKDMVKQTTATALSEFVSKEEVYDKVELSKGFYKKWTPESVKMSRDARLLDTALLELDSAVQKHHSESGEDYAADEDASENAKLEKTDKIKLILNELHMMASTRTKPNGQDYQAATGGNEPVQTAESCQQNVNIMCNSSSRYRTIDGSCNNIQHSNWGRANTPLKRLFFNDIVYEDGRGQPRLTWRFQGDKRIILPNTRLISRRVHQNHEARPRHSSLYSHLLMQYAQFLDHDITLAPEPELECCSQALKNTTRCFNIVLDEENFLDLANDPIHFFSHPKKHQNCISLSRSDPACDIGVGMAGESVREQFNSITAYLDGSNVYGSSTDLCNSLRWNKKSEETLGYLQVNKGNNRDLPTWEQIGLGDSRPNLDRFSKVAGDARCPEHPGLVSMHTLWMNEHNRIAKKLRLNRAIIDFMRGKTLEEKDEFIFQETRRLVAAEMQKITYTEFLPLVLGPEHMRLFNLEVDGPQARYDSNVDVSIANEFATVCFRFGHTLINSEFSRVKPRTRRSESRSSESRSTTYRLDSAFFNRSLVSCENSTCIQNDGNAESCFNRTCMYWTDDILYGLLTTPAAQADVYLTYDVVNSLFFSKELEDTKELEHKTSAESSDLAARNIQRARDHGLPNYNTFRTKAKHARLESLDSFQIAHCNECIEELESGQFYCNPNLLPDRQCEGCVDLGSYHNVVKKFKENSNAKHFYLPCESCIKRKCGDQCHPRHLLESTYKNCSTCFQEQIIALHSCSQPYSESQHVQEKCACKRCVDKSSAKARRIPEEKLGILVEDFIRIGEVYCWHLDSVDAFTGVLAEIRVKGGVVGPTNAAIIGEQFNKIMHGDRFFFHNSYTSDTTMQRGLQRIAKKAILRQSIASVLCNNLKGRVRSQRKRGQIQMKRKPFELNSPWTTCKSILSRARVPFNAIAREIVNTKRRECTDTSQGTNCAIESCSSDKECQEKFQHGDYICDNSQCRVKKHSCFDNNDCTKRNECKENLCSQPVNASCHTINCIQSWEECKNFGNAVFCVCRFSDNPHPNCIGGG